LFTSVGLLQFFIGKFARSRGVQHLDGSAGAAVLLGYLLPPIGVTFMVVGLVEMVR
jgi:hypothetical protein